MILLQPLYSVYEWYISKNLEKDKMPKHVAIIMDGNRRYSKMQGNLNAIEGHKRGVDTLENVLEWCIDLGINIVTVYAFSTENFKRSEKEVEDLMKLFVDSFLSISSNKKIHKNEVRLKAVGRLDLFPEEVRDAIKDAEKSTEKYDIEYRAHVQNKGWMDWKKNGETAGTEGQSLRLEAVEIRFVEKQTADNQLV